MARSIFTAAGRKFDPATAEDPVARKASWKLMTGGRRGGSLYCWRRRDVSDSRVEFELRAVALLFAVFIGLLGVGALSLFGVAVIRSPYLTWNPFPAAWLPMAMLLLFGLLAMWGAISTCRRFPHAVVFDTKRGYFWQGPRDREMIRDLSQIPGSVPLEDVYAIQLVSGMRHGNAVPGLMELNLVLKDGNRVHVLTASDSRKLLEHGQRLRRLLNVDVWNGA